MGVPEQGFDGRTFGKYLRNVRTSRNLSLDSVEEMTHGYPEPVTKSHLSRIENGRAAPSFARMYALSQIYGIPISTLAERFEIDLHRGMHSEVEEMLAPSVLKKALADLHDSGEMLRGLVLATTALERIRNSSSKSTDPGIIHSLRFHRLVFLSRLERYETAKIEAEQMLGELDDSADEVLRFKVLRCFVLCSYELERFTIAKMGLETLRERLDRVPLSLRAHFANLSAGVAHKLGDPRSAAVEYRDACRMFEETNDFHNSYVATLNLAQAYVDMGKTREPAKILNRILQDCERHGYQRLQALALSLLCVIYMKSGDHEPAESYAMRSNAIARPREFVTIVFRNCYYLRKIAQDRDDDKSIRGFERSLKTLLNRADQSMDVVQAFRREIGGESR